MMKCPKCQTGNLTLLKTEFGTNLICFHCSGHLGSLNYFIRHKDTLGYHISDAPAGPEAILQCPKCAENFVKKSVSGEILELTLDICYPCSLVWYDKIELESLFQQIARHNQTKSISKMKKMNAELAKIANQKPSLGQIIRETKYLNAADKAKVLKFLAYGPEKPPLGKPADFCLGIFDLDIDFPHIGDWGDL